MTRDLSSLRAQVLAVQQQMTELLDTFLGRTPLLPGSLYTLRRRCGKPNCRCAQGELHASTVLSYRGQGRPQNISLAGRGAPAGRTRTDRRLPALRKIGSWLRRTLTRRRRMAGITITCGRISKNDIAR
jgi:hypothetical protein